MTSVSFGDRGSLGAAPIPPWVARAAVAAAGPDVFDEDWTLLGGGVDGLLSTVPETSLALGIDRRLDERGEGLPVEDDIADADADVDAGATERCLRDSFCLLLLCLLLLLLCLLLLCLLLALLLLAFLVLLLAVR